MHKKKYEISYDKYIIIDEDLGIHLEDHGVYKKIPSDIYSCLNNPLYETKVDKNCKLEKIFSLEEGVRNGIALELYDTGAVYWQGYYKKGVLHGPSRYFTKEGNILSVTWFFDGNEQGESYQYYMSSKVASVTHYKDGKMHGLQQFFYENGALKSTMNYQNGIIDGDVVLYFKDGKVKRKCSFSEGKKQGVDIIFGENQIVLDEGMYHQGNPCGIHTRRYDSGKLKEQICYSSNNTCSKKVWDEFGELVIGG